MSRTKGFSPYREEDAKHCVEIARKLIEEPPRLFNAVFEWCVDTHHASGKGTPKSKISRISCPQFLYLEPFSAQYRGSVNRRSESESSRAISD
jgi:hypothetical protein